MLAAAAVPAAAQLPVSGPVLHLDAGDVLGTGVNPADGSAVGLWADISASGTVNNATESNVANQPVYRATAVNGLPGVEFLNDAYQDLMVENWAGVLTSGATGFAVVNAITYTWRQGAVWRFGTPGDGGTNYGYGYSGAVHDSFGLQQRASSAITHAGQGLSLYEVTLTDNQDGTGTHQAWYNGLPGAPSGGDLAWTDTPCIGNKAAAQANELNGQIGEIIIYDRVLSDADRNKVATYLADKYGVQRSQGIVVQQDPSYLAYSASQSAMIRGWDTPWNYSWRPVGTGTATASGGALEAYDDTSRSGGHLRVHLEFAETGTYYAYFRCRTNDTDGGGTPYDNDMFRTTETNQMDPSEPAFGTNHTYNDYQFCRNDTAFQWYKVPGAGGAPDASKVYVDTDDVGVLYPWEIVAGNPGPMIDTIIWHTSATLTDAELDEIALSLVILPPHPGDANNDKKVDVFDLAILANHYNVPGDMDFEHGDFDDNDTVNVFDLAILANNYGWAGGGAPIPEPATLLLLAGGAAAALVRRRRK